MTPSQTWSDVKTELSKAIAKFPTWPKDPLHAVAILGEEYGELVKAALQDTYEPGKSKPGEMRKEAIQCAAMAIRFAMSLDEYEHKMSSQLFQEIDCDCGHPEIEGIVHRLDGPCFVPDPPPAQTWGSGAWGKK